MKTNNTTKLPYEGITASVATFEPIGIVCASFVSIDGILSNGTNALQDL